MKILIIKTHAIGDVLMTTPAIRAIRKKYPESHISMLVGEWSKPVVESNPYLDHIITFKDKDLLNYNVWDLSKNQRIHRLIKKLRNERFDAIFMFHRSKFIYLLGWLIGANKRIGINDSNYSPLLTNKALCQKNSDHYAAIDYMNVICTNLKLNKEDLSLDFFVPEQAYKFANSKLKTQNSKLIGICPGGSMNPAEKVLARRWNVDRYAKLCNELIRLNLQPIIFGSKDDILIAQELINRTTGRCINLCGKTTLKQFGAFIEKCKVIITNDSAPLHIAIAVGTPSISLFGPTIGKARVPPDSRHIAIQSNLECSPCYNNRRFPGCKNPRCMEYISVEEVKNAVLKLLNI